LRTATATGGLRKLATGVSHYTTAGRVARFLPRKLAYEARVHTRRPGRNEFAAHTATLDRDGVVVIPDFIDQPTLARMRQALPDISAFRYSVEGEKSFFLPDAHTITELAPFFESPLVRAIARRYVSPAAVPLRRTIGIKNITGELASFEVFHHMDTWKRRMKAFLYIDDVGPAQAPLRYVKRSHHGLWRLPMEATISAMYRVDNDGFARPEDLYVGCFWPHEVQRLSEAYGLEETTCTGPGGTLVIFDGRGLHRATPLVEGSRTNLMSYWIHPGDHT